MEKMDIFVKCLKFFYLYFEDEVERITLKYKKYFRKSHKKLW